MNMKNNSKTHTEASGGTLSQYFRLINMYMFASSYRNAQETSQSKKIFSFSEKMQSLTVKTAGANTVNRFLNNNCLHVRLCLGVKVETEALPAAEVKH